MKKEVALNVSEDMARYAIKYMITRSYNPSEIMQFIKQNKDNLSIDYLRRLCSEITGIIEERGGESDVTEYEDQYSIAEACIISEIVDVIVDKGGMLNETD